MVPNAFADHLDRVPVLLVVLAELGSLAITDRDLTRPSIVAGASIYPFIQNILLAARGEGLGGVLTTLLCRAEPEVAELLRIPSTHALAAVLALGVPERQPTRLTPFTQENGFDAQLTSGPVDASKVRVLTCASTVRSAWAALSAATRDRVRYSGERST